MNANITINRLYTALHEYGQHHDYCISHKTDDLDQCDCGFNDSWEPLEKEALLKDANQTAIYLDKNDALEPDKLIFSQAANIMRGLIEVIETNSS